MNRREGDGEKRRGRGDNMKDLVKRGHEVGNRVGGPTVRGVEYLPKARRRYCPGGEFMAVNGGGGLRRWPRWYRRSYQAISGQSRRLTSAPGNNDDARLDVSPPCRVACTWPRSERGRSVGADGGRRMASGVFPVGVFLPGALRRVYLISSLCGRTNERTNVCVSLAERNEPCKRASTSQSIISEGERHMCRSYHPLCSLLKLRDCVRATWNYFR